MAILSVARYATSLIDNGLTASCQSIEKGRFPNIGTTYYGYNIRHASLFVIHDKTISLKRKYPVIPTGQPLPLLPNSCSNRHQSKR